MMEDTRYGIQDTGYRIHDGYKMHGTRVPVSCTLHRISCIILLLFASCILHPASAQLYPVQSTLQITPPYSLTLADYVAPGSEKVALNIFLADVNRPELSVRLRLRIEGVGIRIETKAEYLPEPMMISGGVPLRLIGADLVDYFDPRNLNFSGITQREYEQKAALPEGLYQFTFEVIEYNRGVKISNSATVMAWLILNDPPLINLPKDNDKIRIQSPQQVIFQWTPRHTGSPNSAFSTEYEFRLVELWPSTRNPNDAILTSPAIFETTTAASTLIYGPAETPLEPGRRYAFRIKAKSIVGVDELNLFKNNGYSQVSTFVYGDACTLPTGIQAEVISSSKIGFAWDTQDNHTGYNIKYRLANTPNAAWYTNTSALNDIEINSLQPSTTYEYQVAAACGFYDSEYSPVATVTTNEAQAITYSCGLPLNPFDLDPSQLIESLKTGDVIQAGDFDVKLTEVSGSNGIFTGKGVIEVPFFNKARLQASFSGISVNKELRMVAGSMNITGGGVEVVPAGVMDMMDELTEALALADSALNLVESNLPQPFDPHSFVADKEVKIPGTITSVTKGANGGVVVTASNGTEQTIPAGGATAITDSNGNGYLIDSKGNIHPTTAAIASAAARREYNLNVNFAKASDTRFGFDAKKHDALLTTYEHVKDTYYASWKSIATGQTDNALALLEGTNVDKTKIHFEQSGQAVTANTQSPSPNTQVLSIKGIADGVQESLVALYTSADTTQKEQVLGKLNVITYNQIDKHVVIVPVNGNTFDKFGTVAILQDSLNKIYNQGIVNWTVELKPGITVEGIAPFEDGGTGLLSNFTSHMKKVINAYKENTTPDTYYLFLVSNPQDPSTLGVMPRSKEYGFIFADKHSTLPEVARTIAHELGHGAFNLHHTFMEPNYTITQGTTDNLMDYPAGPKLYKYQWDKIRYPDIVVGIFDSDKEGELHGDPKLSLINWEESKDNFKSKVFIEPGGRPIDIKGAIPYAFYNEDDSDPELRGTLHSFILNDILYGVYIKLVNGKYVFSGYAPNPLRTGEFDKEKITLLDGDANQKQLVRISSNCVVTIIRNGVAQTPFPISNCGYPMPLSGFAKGFYDHHSVTDGIDKKALERVSQLISQMGEDFYTKYLPDAITVSLTNENLLAMEKSLTNYIEVQKNLYGSVGLVSFEKLVTFLNLCYENYKEQLDNKDNHDIVPRCIWENQISPLFYYTSADLAFSAGVVDGAWELIRGVTDLLNFVDCWNPGSTSMRFWFDETCVATRQKTKNFFSAMGSITEGENMSVFGSAVGDELGKYYSSLTGFTPDNRHEQGKLTFTVASFFFGGGEASTAINTAKITEKTAVAMQKLAALISRIKLPPSLILKVQKLATGTTVVIALSTGTISAEVATLFPRTATAIEYVIKMGDNVASVTPKITEAIATNSSKIAESASKAEQAILKFADKAGKSYDLGGGKYFATDVGDFVVMSMQIDSKIINIQAIEKATQAVIILSSLTGSESDGTSSENKPDCNFCVPSKKLASTTCLALEQLQIKTGNAAGVQKLCKDILLETTLEQVVVMLNSYSDAYAKAFLSDIIGNTTDPTEAISKNTAQLNVGIVEAWKAMTDAANVGTALSRDYVLLGRIKNIRETQSSLNAFNYGTIGNFQEFLKTYSFANCNTCSTPPVNSYPYNFQKLDKILDNTLRGFQIHDGKPDFTTSFYAGEVFAKDAQNKRDGGQFMLHVMSGDVRTNAAVQIDRQFKISFPQQVTGNFEFDIYLGNTDPTGLWFIECKSTDELPAKIDQLQAYFSVINNISNLEYVFNTKKIGTIADAKAQIQSQLINNSQLTAMGVELFNTIWANANLNRSLWSPTNYPNITQAQARLIFTSWVADTNSSIYSFIKVK